jgi:predicted nuclease of restriction endonuclease-like RecB superfamily
LESELEEYVGTGTDYRILRGLIKLLTDRCEFETASVAAPEDIRRRVFSKPANTSRSRLIQWQKIKCSKQSLPNSSLIQARFTGSFTPICLFSSD